MKNQSPYFALTQSGRLIRLGFGKPNNKKVANELADKAERTNREPNGAPVSIDGSLLEIDDLIQIRQIADMFIKDHEFIVMLKQRRAERAKAKKNSISLAVS